MWHFLFQHAICRLYGSRWNACFASRHRLYDLSEYVFPFSNVNITNKAAVVKSFIAAATHTAAPVLSLVLLALILGLPAVLIVLTAHRFSYVMWMGVYLLSLPIWNGILPMYAFWKFDDFSWGDTRKTAGEKTKKAGIEYEGEFDSSKITMKRWGEFEHERRMKGGSQGWSHGSPSTVGGSPAANGGGFTAAAGHQGRQASNLGYESHYGY